MLSMRRQNPPYLDSNPVVALVLQAKRVQQHAHAKIRNRCSTLAHQIHPHPNAIPANSGLWPAHMQSRHGRRITHSQADQSTTTLPKKA